MSTHFEDIQKMYRQFGLLVYDSPGHLTRRKLQERLECLQEELDEFRQACNTQNLYEQADALIDLVVFALGTAVMLGLPWQALWDDVLRANLTKARGVGKRGHAVDLVKPSDWVPPQTLKILLQAGYEPSDETRRDDQ